jgi:excisionase family DNA binding protein
MTEQAVDSKALAEHMRTTVYTVCRYARTGKIPAFKWGSEWRFYVSEVDAHVHAPKDPWLQSAQSRGRKRKTASGN